ncbi:MAG: hydroxymethylglutaryl-CoA lyase [Cryomorphaceae bacterium]
MSVKLIECPRDAMQGMEAFIPTDVKARYINHLLTVGFDTIDFGSFVSPKAIPQLKDTADVLSKLDLSKTSTKLLAIVANRRGAEDASHFDPIDFLGYPFSISETFQKRNTNATIDQSLKRVEEMQSICGKSNKKMLVYISMAFGNPYGDPWSGELAAHWVERLHEEIGIDHIALADTVGVSDVSNIKELFQTMIPAFPSIEVGAHLHTRPSDAHSKVLTAYTAGCRRFDSAMKGYGGCPMAEDELVGNLATEQLISTLKEETSISINEDAFSEALILADKTFPI